MNNHFSSPGSVFFVLFLCAQAFAGRAQTSIDSLPPVDSLSDRQVNEFCSKLAADVEAMAQEITANAQAATDTRSALEATLASIKNDSTVQKSTVDSVKTLLKLARAAEKMQLSRQKDVQKLTELSGKTAEADNVTQRKNLPKIYASLRKMQEANLIARDKPEEKQRPKKAAKKEKKQEEQEDTVAAEREEKNVPAPATQAPPVAKIPPSKTSKPVSGKYDPAKDVMLFPPDLPCTWAQEKKDEFSGEIYRRTQAYELFRNTPLQLKAFLDGKANVICEASLAGSSADVSLLLRFTVHDPNPRKSFGKLDKNSLLTILFMDGAQYNLNNQILSEGVQNEEDQSLVYQGQYALTPELVKKLKRMELDRIRVAWSSGYEDYEVQYVQLLEQLSKCY